MAFWKISKDSKGWARCLQFSDLHCCRAASQIGQLLAFCHPLSGSKSYMYIYIYTIRRLVWFWDAPQYPANTQSNKHVIISSKRRFDVMITCLLRCVFAGYRAGQADHFDIHIRSHGYTHSLRHHANYLKSRLCMQDQSWKLLNFGHSNYSQCSDTLLKAQNNKFVK